MASASLVATFRLGLSRNKQAPAGLSPASSWGGGGIMGFIRESFAGAWQSLVTVESTRNILAFSAVYSCIALIADDISKLRLRLMKEDAKKGISTEVSSSPLGAVLKKPNRYQTRIQFFAQWIVCKLLYGNAFILKERDARQVVVAMYVLDPRLCVPLIAPDGAVYYQLKRDYLSGIEDDGLVVPASEIIHDRCNSFFHPLVGLSPIYACGASATQGIRIQANSARFFENMSRPSGIVSWPSVIPDDRLKAMKTEMELVISSGNLGRLLLIGDGGKFEPMTIPAGDAQLIEQLRWTKEDVASAFKVPLYKLGGPMPTFASASAMNQDYYTQTLQAHIEAIEILLDEGLGLTTSKVPYCTEFDLDGLLRMDPATRMEVAAKGIGSAILMPNDGRAQFNLGPVEGGDQCYLQQQNYSLAALAKRDQAGPAPHSAIPALPAPAAAPTNAPQSGAAQGAAANADKETADLFARLKTQRGFVHPKLYAPI